MKEREREDEGRASAVYTQPVTEQKGQLEQELAAPDSLQSPASI